MAKYSLIAITFLTEKQKEGRKDNLYDVHVTVWCVSDEITEIKRQKSQLSDKYSKFATNVDKRNKKQ